MSDRTPYQGYWKRINSDGAMRLWYYIIRISFHNTLDLELSRSDFISLTQQRAYGCAYPKMNEFLIYMRCVRSVPYVLQRLRMCAWNVSKDLHFCGRRHHQSKRDKQKLVTGPIRCRVRAQCFLIFHASMSNDFLFMVAHRTSHSIVGRTAIW